MDIARMMGEATRYTPCRLCGQAEARPWRYGLLQCSNCGVVFSPDVWFERTNEKMGLEWFEESYLEQRSQWIDWFERRNNRRTLDRIAKAHPVGKRLLEIGVGSGSLLRTARQRGYEVCGCDLSTAISKHVQERDGIVVHNGHLRDVPRDRCFDVIIMNHVLEHVEDPSEFMQEAASRLSTGGIIHIAVPNVDSWEAGLGGWNSFEPYHLYYFGPHTLRNLVEKQALLVKCLCTTESFSGWYLAIVRTALRINPLKVHSTPVIVSGMYHRREKCNALVESLYRLSMIGTGVLLLPLRIIQGHLGHGDELVCIGQKPFTQAQGVQSVHGDPKA